MRCVRWGRRLHRVLRRRCVSWNGSKEGWTLDGVWDSSDLGMTRTARPWEPWEHPPNERDTYTVAPPRVLGSGAPRNEGLENHHGSLFRAKAMDQHELDPFAVVVDRLVHALQQGGPHPRRLRDDGSNGVDPFPPVSLCSPGPPISFSGGILPPHSSRRWRREAKHELTIVSIAIARTIRRTHVLRDRFEGADVANVRGRKIWHDRRRGSPKRPKQACENTRRGARTWRWNGGGRRGRARSKR